MIDLKQVQKEIYQNKVKHGFNTTDINMEFCLTYGELNEAYEAWLKKKGNVGEELADVAIYLIGLCEILGVDFEDELVRKMKKNAKRKYKRVNGTLVRIKTEDDK